MRIRMRMRIRMSTCMCARGLFSCFILFSYSLSWTTGSPWHVAEDLVLACIPSFTLTYTCIIPIHVWYSYYTPVCCIILYTKFQSDRILYFNPKQGQPSPSEPFTHYLQVYLVHLKDLRPGEYKRDCLR